MMKTKEEILKVLKVLTDAIEDAQECIRHIEGLNYPDSPVVEVTETSSEALVSDSSEETLEQKVTKVLRNIGVPAHIKGYYYVREAIMLCVEDRRMLEYVTKELYPTIAKKYQSTPSRVERAIRHAIEVSWRRGSLDVQEELFGYTVDTRKCKPTNAEFIGLISDDICLNQNI